MGLGFSLYPRVRRLDNYDFRIAGNKMNLLVGFGVMSDYLCPILRKEQCLIIAY